MRALRQVATAASVGLLLVGVLPVTGGADPAAGQPVDPVAAGVSPADPTTVRLVIDDPDVASSVAEEVAGAEVAVSTPLFAAVEAPATEAGEIRDLALREGAGRVEEDVLVRPAGLNALEVGPSSVIPSDPYFSQGVGLQQLRLPDAWLATLGDASTVIGVIDTGVAEVPELTGRLLSGRSFGSARPARVSVSDPNDDAHGTMAAVVAAGAAGNGVASVGSCPRCRVLPLRVFDNSRSDAYLSDVAAAIVWATDNGADVISMSLAGIRSTSSLEAAARYANERGVLLAGAAGNEGTSTPRYPAALPEVFGVGAITDDATLYSFSNRGSWVGYAAHGCNWAMDDSAQVRRYCGTSSATPLLAGVLALYRTVNPNASPAQARSQVANASTRVAGLGGGYPDAPQLVGNPFGSLDTSVQFGPRAVRVSGWVIDPDSPDPVDVEVRIDGAVVGRATADLPRADVGKVYPASGPNHGFVLSVPAAPGRRQVCVRALNAGAGTLDPTLGCRSVEVRSGNPIGSLDLAAQFGPRTIRISGWALDFDTAGAVDLHVYLNGRQVVGGTTSLRRSDVGRIYPGYQDQRGFRLDVAAQPGQNVVCVTALNAGSGTAHTWLGCHIAVVRAGTPVGSFDRLNAVSATSARLRGWSLDYDTVASTRLHVYVNGRFALDASANLQRSDVGAAFPGYGSAHGFDMTVPAARGAEVCVYALNAARGGSHGFLGCRQVP